MTDDDDDELPPVELVRAWAARQAELARLRRRRRENLARRAGGAA